MDTIQRDRLLRLATFLETLPEGNWEIRDWHGHAHEIGVGLKHGDSKFETPVQAMECGTACCVAGWAAVLNADDWLEEFGTETVELENDGTTRETKVLRVDDCTFADFFGITLEAADYICTKGMGMSAPEKAVEIREVVSNDGYEMEDNN